MKAFSTRMARGAGAGKFMQHAFLSAKQCIALPNALGIKSPASTAKSRQFRAARRLEGSRSVMVITGKVRYQGLSELGRPQWA